MRHTIFVVMTLAPLVAMTRTAASQSSAGQVAVSAGSATDERGVRSDAVSLAPSLVFTGGPNAGLVLGATATRFTNTSWQLGAAAAFSARTSPVARFALALNGGGSVAQASFNATFAQADATPAAQWTLGSLTLTGGAHVASGYAAVSAQPPSSLLPSTTPLASMSRTLFAPSFSAELRFGAGSPVSTMLSFREEPARVGGLLVTDQLAAASLSFGAVTVSGLAGHRSAPDELVDFASASASIPLTSALSFTVAGGKYPSNRLTGAAGGRFSSAGFALRLGGPRASAPPQPAGVRAPPSDLTRLTIRAASAERVELAGDWSSWTLANATRAPNGVGGGGAQRTPGGGRGGAAGARRRPRAPAPPAATPGRARAGGGGQGRE
ncbi:MAG: hypothetical protein ACHQQR_08370, partial [Gemmatimonadales bacterium]